MLDMMDLIGKHRNVNVGKTPPGLYAGEGEMSSILESWLM